MKKYIYLFILFLIVCIPAIAGTIHSYDLKSPPDDADEIVIYDSDDGSTKKIEVGDISGSGSTSGWTDGGTNVYPTDTTDNVSIGTTTPNAASLEIVKQGTTIPLKVSSSATGNGDYMVVTSGGAVGIGTFGPLDANNQFYLNFYKNSNALRAIALNNPNTGTSAALGLELQTSDAQGYVRTYPTNASNATQAGRTWLYSSAGNGLGIGTDVGDIAFYTNFLGRAMTILNSSKNVGIGTAVPNQKLEVIGTVKATAFVGDGSGLTGLASGGSWTDGGTNLYPTDTTDTVSIGTTEANSSSLEIVKQGTTIPLKISSSATGNGNYLVVTSEGAVGIGTTGPLAANNQFYLNLYKNNNALRSIAINNPNTGTSAAVGLELATSDSSGYLRNFPTNFALSASYAGRTMLYSATGNGIGIGTDVGDIAFYTNFLGRAMTITNVGKNVGIGTLDPMARLAVIGTGGVGIGTTGSGNYARTTPPSGGMIVSGSVGIGTYVPQSKLQVDGVITPKKATSDPCTAAQEGGIFYNDTSNYWCGCNGTDDVKLTDNTTACF